MLKVLMLEEQHKKMAHFLGPFLASCVSKRQRHQHRQDLGLSLLLAGYPPDSHEAASATSKAHYTHFPHFPLCSLKKGTVPQLLQFFRTYILQGRWRKQERRVSQENGVDSSTGTASGKAIYKQIDCPHWRSHWW